MDVHDTGLVMRCHECEALDCHRTPQPVEQHLEDSGKTNGLLSPCGYRGHRRDMRGSYDSKWLCSNKVSTPLSDLAVRLNLQPKILQSQFRTASR